MTRIVPVDENPELSFHVDELDLAAVEKLQALHGRWQLRLQTSLGPAGTAYLNDVPQALVSELLRLARLGALLRAEAERDGAQSVAAAVRHADARLFRSLVA